MGPCCSACTAAFRPCFRRAPFGGRRSWWGGRGGAARPRGAWGRPEMEAGWTALGGRGLWVEPTSAVVWPALHNELASLPDPVVAVLTGSGFKSTAHFLCHRPTAA